MRRGSRGNGTALRGGKLWPKGRQWIGQDVLRKDSAWGKDWFPGKVTQWNEVTNKHHIVYEKTVDWEEFDEWLNLDKASPAMLKWEGELPDAEGDVEEDEDEAVETETLHPKTRRPPRKKARASTSLASAAMLSLEDKIAYINEKLSSLQREVVSPVATQEEVGGFEKVHGITLPSAYRDFLLKVANGGCGPSQGGLVALGGEQEEQMYKLDHEFPFQSSDFADPKKMYLGQRRVYTGGMAIPGDAKKVDPAEAKLAKQFNDGGWGGLLLVGADGKGEQYYLVISGPDRGNIWLLANEFFGPLGVDFLDWYAQWLDRQRAGTTAVSGYPRVVLSS